MVALRERLGRTLEGLGKGLRTGETKELDDTPYGNAQRLCGVLAPDRKINPRESAFLRFTPSYDEGVKTENLEQDVFCNLLQPYRSLFPEFDVFTVSLSLSSKFHGISFKMEVIATPWPQLFGHDKRRAILTIKELPEQKGSHTLFPYNMLIIGEGTKRLHTGILDQEFIGVNPEKEPVFTKYRREELQPGLAPKGDPMWRRGFVNETLKHLIKIAEEGKPHVVEWNREQQVFLEKRKKKLSWWTRNIKDPRLQPGAIWPENLHLYIMRYWLRQDPLPPEPK